MKTHDEILQRILSLGRLAAAPVEESMPFGLETMVMAHWRDARQLRLTNPGLLRRLRWAALAACAVAIFAAVWSAEEVAELSHLFAPETHVVDSAMLTAYGND